MDKKRPPAPLADAGALPREQRELARMLRTARPLPELSEPQHQALRRRVLADAPRPPVWRRRLMPVALTTGLALVGVGATAAVAPQVFPAFFSTEKREPAPVRSRPATRSVRPTPTPVAVPAPAISSPPPATESPAPAPPLSTPPRALAARPRVSPPPVAEPVPTAGSPVPAATEVRAPTAASLIARALQALRTQRAPEGALRLLDEHDRLYGDGPLASEAFAARIEALMEAGQHGQALRRLDDAQALTLPAHLVLRGELRAQAGRCQQAAADFDALANDARAERSLLERALYGRAVCRARMGDRAGARADFEAYLSRFPQGRLAAAARRALNSAGEGPP